MDATLESRGFLLVLSEHAEQRIKERTSLNRKAARRLLDSFYVKRLAPNDTTKDLRAWLEGKLDTRDAWKSSGIVNGVLWIISGFTVVTVIPVPKYLEVPPRN